MPTLAVLSDTHVPVTARLTRAVSRMSIDALLFAGDHHPTRFGVSRLSAASWRRSIGRPLNDAVIGVPGNHDYAAGDGLDAWRRRFERWWPPWVQRTEGPGSFIADLGYLRVIGLDTGRDASRVDDEQLTWLQALAPTQAAGPLVVLAHAPLFPVAGHIGGSLDADPDRRDALLAELFRLRALAYLCGHEHLFAHRRITSRMTPTRTLHQVTLGGGGASVEQPATADLDFSSATHHIGLLDIATSDRVSLRVLDADGRNLWSIRLSTR